MKTTLVINPKGGAGKTTVAINLASYFANERIPCALMDYDPQGSSLNWLRLRSPELPKIHGANAAPEKYGRLRSFEMYVPPEVRQLVIDAPAGASGVMLHEMLERSSSIVVPLVPSMIDLHATGNFLRELLAMRRIQGEGVRVAIVANKVRRTMPAYPPLQELLQSLGVRLLGRLIDSDVFQKAAEQGRGIFEMNAGLAVAECRQFAPIIEWVTGAAAALAAPLPSANHAPVILPRAAAA